eukprot:COSAG01_NODE_5774_length_4040_cov_16.478051_1_plen_152_part_00
MALTEFVLRQVVLVLGLRIRLQLGELFGSSTAVRRSRLQAGGIVELLQAIHDEATGPGARRIGGHFIACTGAARQRMLSDIWLTAGRGSMHTIDTVNHAGRGSVRTGRCKAKHVVCSRAHGLQGNLIPNFQMKTVHGCGCRLRHHFHHRVW